jgi:hypothetical protein
MIGKTSTFGQQLTDSMPRHPMMVCSGTATSARTVSVRLLERVARASSSAKYVESDGQTLTGQKQGRWNPVNTSLGGEPT